ncbi:MAG: VOC family protein [Pseudomonadota bacterium]
MPSPNLTRFDHVVLTVASIEATCSFYTYALGMEVERFRGPEGGERHALRFGTVKINLHEVGKEREPKALLPTPGGADLCLLTDEPVEDWLEHLARKGVEVELGPVPRQGALGELTSIYVRDPDRNLIEIARYQGAAAAE